MRGSVDRVLSRTEEMTKVRERCPSGRRRTLGKRVYGNVSWVRIPPSPPTLLDAVPARMHKGRPKIRGPPTGRVGPRRRTAGVRGAGVAGLPIKWRAGRAAEGT